MDRTFGGRPWESFFGTGELRGPQANRAIRPQLRFASGHTGRVRCSMWSSDLLQLSAKVVGDRGQLRVLSPVARTFVGSRSDPPRANVSSASRGAPPSRISLTLSPRRCCAANR